MTVGMPNGAPEYRVAFSHSAEKELAALDPPVARRVLAAIERLKANPRPPDCVKLTGSENDWRIRVGDWRVVYRIDDARQLVEITIIAHRRDVYREL